MCVRVSPRKLNYSTFSMIVLQILGVSVFTFLLCMWNNINLVLAILSRGVTIRYPHDTIRIAILESRYDTYRDTW